MQARLIVRDIYMIGGPDISASEDAAVYLVAQGKELVMIDSGAGRSEEILVGNIRKAGFDPSNLKTLVLTHCHVDHIGAAAGLRERFGCRIIAHDLDADAIMTGDPRLTASSWYEVNLPSTTVDVRIKGEGSEFHVGEQKFFCLHTPGHTPGSMVVHLERDGQRVLFGQDIHGPFHSDFGSDIKTWRDSMEKLIDLEADILCEGHFGIYKPKEGVERYIREYLNRYTD